jgi:hypothetical protein
MQESLTSESDIPRYRAARSADMLTHLSLKALESIYLKGIGQTIRGVVPKDMRLITDMQRVLFASQGFEHVNKDFYYKGRDLDFLWRTLDLVKGNKKRYAGSKKRGFLPELVDPNREIDDLLWAFTNLNGSGGRTEDLDAWRLIENSIKEEGIEELIRENLMTVVIMQLSDGAIDGDDKAIEAINRLREMGIAVGGCSIGGNIAYEALCNRHGEGFVLRADTMSDMSNGYGDFLNKLIVPKFTGEIRKI